MKNHDTKLLHLLPNSNTSKHGCIFIELKKRRNEPRYKQKSINHHQYTKSGFRHSLAVRYIMRWANCIYTKILEVNKYQRKKNQPRQRRKAPGSVHFIILFYSIFFNSQENSCSHRIPNRTLSFPEYSFPCLLARTGKWRAPGRVRPRSDLLFPQARPHSARPA